MPAWRWRATDEHAPEWAPTLATTTATGMLDLAVTNLDFQMHSLFRGLGRLFAYATPESGVGPATLPFVGFGVVFFDFDHDMQLDVAFANGHIMDNPVPQTRRIDLRAAEPVVSQRRAPPVRRRDGAAGSGSRSKRSVAAWPPATSTTTATWICSSPTTVRVPTCCATREAAATRSSFA